MTEFRLDLTDERLWRGDQLVRISNKAFKLLQLLARNPNRLLTKDMILEEVWQDVCVSEGLVKEYVHDLRQALGDDPKNPMFVETVRGRGYRFLGGVDLVDDTAEAAGGSTARNEPPALAVLPFANLTGDERWARFCHGLGDDLVTDLARYPDLTVVANGAGAARLEDDLDVRDLGGELGVSYVLGGSVQASKTSVRVNVKLIETANGNHAWTEQYQRDVGDFLDIQSDIVGHVAAAVGAVGGQIPHRERLRLGRRSPQDMQVYELYLLGQELEARFDQASVLRGVELLQRAVTLDPDYARAWLVLGWLCLQVVLEDWAYDPVEYRALMRQAFLTAAALDPLDPFAAMELAAVRAREGDQGGAGDALERALDLGGNQADLLIAASVYQATIMDDPGRALQCLDRGLDLLATVPQWHHMSAARVAYFGGDFDRAMDHARRGPDNLVTRLFGLLSTAQRGGDGALEDLAKSFRGRYATFEPPAFVAQHPITASGAEQLFLTGIGRAGLA